MARKPASKVEDITRDLDLVVFNLERTPPAEPTALLKERRRLRRELEVLRDRLSDVVRDLE